jgi:hypothetical protein
MRWFGDSAVEVAGGPVHARFAPARGGKIVSLVDASGREWLAQPHPPLAPLGSTGFVDGDMCGWDECAPTIDACSITGGAPAAVPDHGEAWSAEWQDFGDGWFGYAGRALPYVFARAIVATAAGLRLRYRVEVARSMPFLWAAHPQFAAPPGTRVLLPSSVESVTGTYGVVGDHVWGADLARVDGLPVGGARKVWLRAEDRVGWAALERPDGARLRLSWDPSLVPYLGLWFDHCAFSREPVVAVEPATGWRDRLDLAAAGGAVSWATPEAPLEWWIDVEVVDGVRRTVGECSP